MRYLHSLGVSRAGLTIGFMVGFILASNIAIPFYPVPFTLQTMVLMIAVLNDRKVALYASSGYLILGLIGLPVFCNFSSGLALLLSPSAGYVFGFVVASYIASKLPNLTNFSVLLIIELVVFAIGIAYLSKFISFSKALYLGGEVFIIPEIIKAFLAVKLNKFITNSK